MTNVIPNKKSTTTIVLCSIIITSILVTFCPKFSYSENVVSDSFGSKNSANIEQKNNHDDSDLGKHDFTFAAVGDWSCNKEAIKTASNILATDPDIILGLGDYSYQDNMKCWKDIVEGIDPQILKISFGNHEFESQSLAKQYMDYTNLDQQYYSFNHNNVHFIAMSTEAPYEEGSKQFKFVQDDLIKTKDDSSIDWIIVYFHQAMYTTKSNHEGLESFRDTYHSLFEKFGVDLVLQGHLHNYQRTYPLLYNDENPAKPTIIQAAVLGEGSGEDLYVDSQGTIFAIVGTGGQEFHQLDDQSYFNAKQFEEYGFLEIKVVDNGNRLDAEFYGNDGEIKDKFSIEKSAYD
ncbi:MAG TPA: metallophosphoesterase [Nitrososphaeraceae archaeon]|nr:metallophosphoesterase [Nitrososphaeraceae archaeon]